MADTLHITHTGNTLRSLARATYNLSGSGSRARESAALAALVRANPHLNLSANLPPGAVVVIPEVEGVVRQPSPAAEHAVETDTARAAELDRMQDAIEGVTKALASTLAARSQVEKDHLAFVSSHRKELSAIDPQLGKALDALAENATNRLSAMKSESADNKKRLKILSDGVNELRKTLAQRQSLVPGQLRGTNRTPSQG